MNKLKPIMPDDLNQEVLYNIETAKMIWENCTFVRWRKYRNRWVLVFLYYDEKDKKVTLHLRPNNIITGKTCVYLNE